MLAGSLFVGVHMALTHGVTLGMVASYIPATEIPGIGRITGTCWSFTDFVFGARPAEGLSQPYQVHGVPVMAYPGLSCECALTLRSCIPYAHTSAGEWYVACPAKLVLTTSACPFVCL